MNCKYEINGEIRNCFYGQYSGMTMYDKSGYKEEDNFDVVKNAENRPDHFVAYGEKILFTDMVCRTPQELVDAINAKEDVFDSDLCATLIKHGIDCLTVKMLTKPLERYDFGGGLILSFRTDSPQDKDDDMVWVDYMFTDSQYNRHPEDCYKLVLCAKDPNVRHWFPYEDYYVSDLVSLIAARPDLFQICVSKECAEREISHNV